MSAVRLWYQRTQEHRKRVNEESDSFCGMQFGCGKTEHGKTQDRSSKEWKKITMTIHGKGSVKVDRCRNY